MRTRIGLVLGFLCAVPALASADDMRLSALPASAMPPSVHPGIVSAESADVLHQLARQYTTPKMIGQYLRKEFKFQRDQEIFGEIEHWQTPREFLNRRTGDCEDYALLARDLLVQNGIEAYVFSLFGDEGYAHTVCVFVEDGRYNVINQDKVRYYRAQNLHAVASQMYPGWTFGGIVEQEGIRGRMVQEIINPHPVAAMTASLDAPPAFDF